MSFQVSFITSKMEKMGKKVKDFLLFPKGVCRKAPATTSLLKIPTNCFDEWQKAVKMALIQ